MNTGKLINDPIHGYIPLTPLDLSIIDTPEFYRLRRLKQLGTTDYVFPGTKHMAEEMITRLSAHQPELEITQREIDCVRIAGLCHDLGHGPFSHVFDGEFIPRARPGINWTHEDGSEMLFTHLVDSNGIDLETEDVRLIQTLIQGDYESYGKRRFLFDIVANKRNSIDVDKFDYIARDCHSINLKSSYDPLSHKEVYNIYEMFHMRYSLFKRVYTHKVSKAVEFMIVDAMLAADEYFQISSSIDDPTTYTDMTDDILVLIHRSKAPELQKARDIIERISRRQLYKFVDEYTISSHLTISQSQVTPHAILLYHEEPNTVKDDDVIIQWLKTNYGKGNENPVDYVRFFGKWDSENPYRIPKNRVSYVIPEHYSEITIRIYARLPEKVPGLQKAFRKWLKSNVLCQMAQSAGENGDRLDVFSGNTVPFSDKEWQVISQRWSPMKTPDARKNKEGVFREGGVGGSVPDELVTQHPSDLNFDNLNLG